MAPLDPDAAAGGKLLSPLVEHGVGYIVTAVLAWLTSRLNVRKQIKGMEKSLSERFDAMQEEMLMRQSTMELQIQSMAQELYGAKGNGGMIRHLEQVQSDVQQLNERTAGMDAKLDLLITRS